VEGPTGRECRPPHAGGRAGRALPPHAGAMGPTSLWHEPRRACLTPSQICPCTMPSGAMKRRRNEALWAKRAREPGRKDFSSLRRSFGALGRGGHCPVQLTSAIRIQSYDILALRIPNSSVIFHRTACKRSYKLTVAPKVLLCHLAVVCCVNAASLS